MLSTFFVDQLDGKLNLFHNLLGLSHSLLDPHFIWESPSLDWISLFRKLNKSILNFEHKIWRIKYFFRRPPRWKIISISNLQGLSQSYAGLQFNWKSPSLDWKSLFKKLHKSIFWARIWQRVKHVFRRSPRWKISSVSEPTKLSQSYAGPHFIWKCPSLDWISLFMKLHKSICNFWAQNLTSSLLFS